MNKQIYRIVFNKLRGLWMVVAENVSGGGKIKHSCKLASAPVIPHQSFSITLSHCMQWVLLAFGGLLPFVSAQADIVADPAAPVKQQPFITNATNGVPLVNIQTPDSHGLSHNTYQQFDVMPNGVILNNSRTDAQTQLGGWVQGNPNLAAGTASTILNEVNSSQPSLLNGFIEVAGSRAQVIVANPSGITCNGCGFINAWRATLTTGSPVFTSGNLSAYRVTGGVIQFLSAGLDTSAMDYTDIISRAVVANAGVWAKTLNVVLGTQQVNVASNGDIGSLTPMAARNEPMPQVALDVAALGGMYAGKIHLIGTELGLGVNNQGVIAATTGELSLDINGQLSNHHTLLAQGTMGLKSTSLQNTGDVLSGAAMQIDTGDLNNQASISAGNQLQIQAGQLTNHGELSGADTELAITDTLLNTGLIDGGNTFVQADTLTNQGLGQLFGDHVAIQARRLNNLAQTINGVNNAATIAARERLDLGVSEALVNQSRSLIFSLGDLFVGGTLDTLHAATGQGDSLTNTDATIEADGNLHINMASIQNLNAGVTTETVEMGTVGYDQFTPRDQAGLYNSADYPAWQIGNQTISWRYGSTYNLPFNFREYWRYIYTGTTSETRIVSSLPADIIAGGNLDLVGNVTNSDSRIIAGGNLTHSGGNLSNLNTTGDTTTTYSGTAYYYDYDGSGHGFDYDIDIYGYHPAPVVTTTPLPTTQYLANTVTTGNGQVASLNNLGNQRPDEVRLNTLASLYRQTDPSANYLIETNPRFASYGQWLSSDYMLGQLSYDPAYQTKRLGDGFYEQRLVREQVNQLTGRRFLAGYSNDQAQYQALMTNGVTFANSHQLVPGVALTEAQVAQLTSDIVWLVTQTVTLPDGSTTQALVPQVYTRLTAGDLSNSGSLISGQTLNINLNTAQSGQNNLINSGTLSGQQVLSIQSDNIQNLLGQMTGNTVSLSAQQDILNQGGSITAQQVLVLNAGKDIQVESTTFNSNNRAQTGLQRGALGYSERTGIDRVAGLYVTDSANGVLVAMAGGNIELNAAQITNNSQNGLTALSAEDIHLGTQQTALSTSAGVAKNYIKRSTTEEVGTQINTVGDIQLQADNTLTMRAATITSEQGNISAQASEIDITAGKATLDSEQYRKTKKSGFMSSSKTERRDTEHDETAIASSLSADSISLRAGNGQTPGDLNITGSDLVATQNVSLTASGNVNVASAQETHQETHAYKQSKTGFSASSTSIGYGSSKLKQNTTIDETTQRSSTIGSIEGNVDISASKDVQVTSSNLIAGQDISVTGQNVTLDAAYDTRDTQQTMQYKQSGIRIGLSAPAITAAQAASNSIERSKEVKDDKLKAVYELRAALNAAKAATAIADAANSSNPAAASGIQLSFSIGTSKASSTSTSHDSVARGDSLTAARDIHVTATGDQEGGGNVLMQAVEGNAGQNLSIHAANDILLLSAENTYEQHSKNKNSSAAVGVAIGSSQEGGAGISVFANASAGKGKANGNSVSHTETTLKAGETFSLESGHDTTLKGAIVSGNTVIAHIGTGANGGNLRMESEQDTASYKSKQSSTSGGVSYTFGAGGLGGSLSQGQQKINSNYTSVIEQTAIQAGDGGFNINVNGNTHLKGAVIDSTLAAQIQNNNSLTTKTLTTEDLENKGEYQASSSTMGVSLNGSPNTGTNNPAGGSVGSSLQAGLGGIGVKESDETHGTTKSAIAGANITITDDAAQQAKTGQTAQQTVAALNRDTQHANGSIDNPFNLQKAQEQLEFLQVAGETILQPAMAQAAKWIGDQFPPDPANPDRIDPAKVLAHAALGAAVSQLLGTGWQTGAVAGALGDVLPQALEKAFEKDASGKIKNEAAFKAANTIISAALTSATGGDIANTINAGMITQNAVENNYLPHIHKNLTFMAAKKAGLNTQQSNVLADLAVKVDKEDYGAAGNSQDIDHAFMHSMCGEGKSIEDCTTVYNNYIKEQFSLKSPLGLARVLHAIEDGYADGHAGLHTYRGFGNLVLSTDGIPHLIGDAMITPAELNDISEALKFVIKSYLQQCPDCFRR